MSKFLLGFVAGVVALPLAILIVARLRLLPHLNSLPTSVDAEWNKKFSN